MKVDTRMTPMGFWMVIGLSYLANAGRVGKSVFSRWDQLSYFRFAS